MIMKYLCRLRRRRQLVDVDINTAYPSMNLSTPISLLTATHKESALMANITTIIPPEIMTSIFEIGIYSCGITFILPVSLVCTAWRDIINDTPRLWGIIHLEKHTPPHIFEYQLSKVKAAPLSVSLPSQPLVKRYKAIMERVTSLSGNWVSADVSTQHLLACSPTDVYRNLENLRLSRGPKEDFDSSTPPPGHPEKLHSFAAISLSRPWVLPFLGPWIKHFRIQHRGKKLKNMDDLECYLLRIPKVVTLELDTLYFSGPILRPPNSPVISLPNLEVLRLANMTYVPSILGALAAPSLQSLNISTLPPARSGGDHVWDTWNFQRTAPIPMAPLFSQWSQEGFIPSNLQNLELLDCLLPEDIPYLIQWLARLPNLVSLFIKDDAGHRSTVIQPDAARQFYDALAFPQVGMDKDREAVWLCPSLTILHLEMTHQVLGDLIPIAQARGRGTSNLYGIPPPKLLRRVQAQICPPSMDVIEERLSFDSLIEQSYCLCNGFALGLGCMGLVGM